MVLGAALSQQAGTQIECRSVRRKRNRMLPTIRAVPGRRGESVTYRLVIFDFDGTLADSASWFVKALNDLAPRHGFRPVTEAEIEMLRGRGNREIIRYLRLRQVEAPVHRSGSPQARRGRRCKHQPLRRRGAAPCYASSERGDMRHRQFELGDERPASARSQSSRSCFLIRLWSGPVWEGEEVPPVDEARRRGGRPKPSASAMNNGIWRRHMPSGRRPAQSFGATRPVTCSCVADPQ